MMPPLILTLRLHPDDQARFDRLRTLHFPPSRNLVPAHVTLFHHLPGDELDAIQVLLAQQAALLSPFPVEASGLRFLGRGVAYELSAQPVEQLRADLVDAWRDDLTAQDRQRWRPHVTVQNKVAPEEARRLHAELSARPLPGPATAQGLALWRYVGGPWEHLHTQSFTG